MPESKIKRTTQTMTDIRCPTHQSPTTSSPGLAAANIRIPTNETAGGHVTLAGDSSSAGHLSPRANQRHAEGAGKEDEAGGDAALPAKDLPALVGEEVDGNKLDEGGVDEEAGGDCVHGAD